MARRHDRLPDRILLVDDHPIVRDGLRGLLEAQPDFLVVGEAASAEEALAQLRRTAADVVITDIRMPGSGGLALIRRLREQHPQSRALVLTTFDTDTEIAEALDAGALGYLLKDAGRAQIYQAVRTVAAGRRTLDAAVASRVAGAVATTTRAAVLSRREIEVLTLVARGMTNSEIGRTLYVSEATIKTHLQHIFRKLGAADRAATVAVAYDTGLLRGRE